MVLCMANVYERKVETKQDMQCCSPLGKVFKEVLAL